MCEPAKFWSRGGTERSGTNEALGIYTCDATVNSLIVDSVDPGIRQQYQIRLPQAHTQLLPGILTPFSERKSIPTVPLCQYAVAPNRPKAHARVERQTVLQFFDASDQLLDLLSKCGRE